MPRYQNEMGPIGAQSKRIAAIRRPLLVGALVAGVVALGASAAVAVGPLGNPSPGPSAPVGPGTGMMSDRGMMSDKGMDVIMKAHMGSNAEMKADMGSSTGPNMMGGDKGIA